MRLHSRSFLGSAIALLLVSACSDDGASTGAPLEPAARPTLATPPSGGQEAPSPMTNAFAPPQGDVQAAYERARARLALASPSAAVAPTTTLAGATGGVGTLVLYDETGPWGWLGELYATNVGSLVSHFGAWKAKPVSKYVAGELGAYAGVVYVGSTFDEPLPPALLDDVLLGTRPVVWIDQNIWQLAARAPSFGTTYGFSPWIYETRTVGEITYKGTSLTRYTSSGAGIMTYSSVTTATTLAQAVHLDDGTRIPWAVKGNNVTYIGENPMSYVTANDRYLAFCDLLFDAFAPATPERHRALVRIEDVNATDDPASLRAIADYLSAEKVPFSVATIPYYTDPLGAENGGVPRSIPLKKAPAVASAIKYMLGKGGTLVMHGYTHQYESVANPYNGVSADDFEFYRAHIDAANYVIYDGPVPLDARAWAAKRISEGLKELSAAKLPRPSIFEYPHYAGSDVDSLAVRDQFGIAYHRGLYFGGQLSGTAANYTHVIGVMYPFDARDVFGFKIIPENLGSYEPLPSNNNPPRFVADIVHTAGVNRVVRDGFASFYFHPYYDVSVLAEIVSGIKALGYSFVSPTTL